MSILAITSGTAGCIAAFVAKQVFSYHCLEPVRLQLQELISKVASNNFGTFVGNIIGREGGILLSMPVTCLLADIVGAAAYETVMTVVHVVNVVFFGAKVEPMTPFFRELGLRTARFATYFFAKSYFCNFCMPLVKLGVEFALRHIVVLSATALPLGFLACPAAIVLTPPLTFLIGDIVGIIAGEVVYVLLGRASRMLFD